jgi:hypothetical protein
VALDVQKVVGREQRIDVTIDPEDAHSGHLGFDVSHRRFARAILEDEDINCRQGEAGYDNLLTTLAADRSITSGEVVFRNEMEAAQQ